MNRRVLAGLALLLPLAVHAEPPGVTRGFQRTPHLTLDGVFGAYRHGHDAEITAVRYLPDGRGMATAATDRTIRIWDGAGDPQVILAGERGRVHTVAASGDLVATGGAALAVHVYDVKSGQRIATLAGHTNNVIALAFSADGKRLVSGGRDQSLRVWDLATGKVARQTATRATPVAAAFSIDGGLVFALLGDGAVLRWDLARDSVAVTGARSVQIDAGAFSADRSLLIAAGQRRLWLVDTGTGALDVVADKTGEVTSVAVAADGSRAVTGDHDGRLAFWDLEARARIFTLRAHPVEITAVDLSPDGRRILSGSRDYTFREWDTRTRQAIDPGHRVYAALELASGELATAGGDGSVRLWSADDGEAIGRLAGVRGGVFALAETADGRLLSGGDDGKLRVWAKGAPRPLAVLAANPGGVLAIAVAGEQAITAGEDGQVRVFDLRRHKEVRAIHVGRPLRALVSDGRRATVAGDDGRIHAVDLATGRIETTGVANGPILALALSGTHLAVGGDDGSVRLDGAIIGRHDDAVRALAFCPDGHCLVSGGRDGIVRLFVGGKEQDRIDLGSAHDAPRALAFTRDGRLLCATERGVTLRFRLR